MDINKIIMESIKASILPETLDITGATSAPEQPEISNTVISKLAKNLPAIGGATAAALAAGLGALALRKKLAATKATTQKTPIESTKKVKK